MGIGKPRDRWTDLAASDYEAAFARFGGSFPVHPRVVRLASELAERTPRYAGVERGGELIAAVPVWGSHVAATDTAFRFYRHERLLDCGDPEVVLPIAADARISLPFGVNLVSSLHATNVAGLKHEARGGLALAKGADLGEQRLAARHKQNLRRMQRKLDAIGATYRPIGSLSPTEAADTFAALYEKRWRAPSPYLANLHRVAELHDMLAGDVLYVDGRPAAIEQIYMHEAGGRLFVNGVQAGWDEAYRDHSVGSQLLFHNLQKFETLAAGRGLEMRYSHGWDDIEYKSQWTYSLPAYRLDPPRSIMRSVRRRLVDAYNGLTRQ